MNSFIETVKPYSLRYGTEGEILPVLILSQAIHESASGSSELAQRANNLFGIKASSSWTGDVYTIQTDEWSKEKGWYTVTAGFRKYPSIEDSVRDLVELYQRPRYAAVKGETDIVKATDAVHSAGYATDPTYPEKLRGIIAAYDLLTELEGEQYMARISVYSLMSRSISNMGAVNSKVKDLAMELIKRAYHEGINVQITSGYRSNAEQKKLYNQGRTTSGNVVTNAGPGQSVHNYGYAIDYVLLNNEGTTAIWVVNNDWKRVAAIGKQLGFQWGGDWSKFPDPPHLDMGGLSWQQLQAGRRPSVPDVPDRGYLGAGDSGPKVKALQEYLNKVGIKINADSDYGPATEAAVKLFQEKRGLAADGIYGAGSLAEMNKALKELDKPQPTPVVRPKPTPKPEAETAGKGEPTMAERIFEAATASLAGEWKKAFDLDITDGANPNGPLTRAQGASFIVRALENDEILERIADKVADKLK